MSVSHFAAFFLFANPEFRMYLVYYIYHNSDHLYNINMVSL